MRARPRRRRRAAPGLRRWLRRQDRLTRILAVAVIALSILVVALLGSRRSDPSPSAGIARDTPGSESAAKAPERRAAPARGRAARATREARAPQALPHKAAASSPRGAPEIAASPGGPRLAIVIDDLGQSFSHFEQLVSLDIPLSIAVIPGLPASARTASEASRRGVELLLHQPMEPREEAGKNPGEGVLLTSMTEEAIRARVRASLAAVPGAVGVNNHMGSRFTEDPAGLAALMAEIKEHGLFWLDSRTTAATRGLEAAHAAGVPALARDVFIDAEVGGDAIRRQLRKLLVTARTRGAAVGIGHPHPETIAVLRELRAELLASGVTLVNVSALVHSAPAAGSGARLAAALTGKVGAGGPAADAKAATP